MLLSQTLLLAKDNFEVFSGYSARIEPITHIFNKVIFENENNLIEFYIELMEGYISVLFRHKPDHSLYYALSDYSYLDGAKSIFDELGLPNYKETFYRQIRTRIRKRRKPQGQMELANLVLDLVARFNAHMSY